MTSFPQGRWTIGLKWSDFSSIAPGRVGDHEKVCCRAAGKAACVRRSTVYTGTDKEECEFGRIVFKLPAETRQISCTCGEQADSHPADKSIWPDLAWVSLLLLLNEVNDLSRQPDQEVNNLQCVDPTHVPVLVCVMFTVSVWDVSLMGVTSSQTRMDQAHQETRKWCASTSCGLKLLWGKLCCGKCNPIVIILTSFIGQCRKFCASSRHNQSILSESQAYATRVVV